MDLPRMQDRLTGNSLVAVKGEGDTGGMEWELGIIGRANNKVLLNSTGNYSQYPVINHNGKEYKTCPYV